MDKDFNALRKALGANVRRLRKAQKLSQETLAFEAGIDRTYVSQIERAVINPSLLVLHKIAKALQVSVIDLIRSEYESPPLRTRRYRGAATS